MGGRGAAQTQARQDCEQRLGVRRRPASPSSFARSYRHTPDPPPPPSGTCPSVLTYLIHMVSSVRHVRP